MPSVRSSEEHDAKIAYLAKNKEKILDYNRRKFDKELEFARKLPQMERHIPTARFSTMINAVIKNRHRREEIGEMLGLVESHAAEHPMPRQRANYLQIVAWRKKLDVLLNTCRAATGKSQTGSGIRKEMRK